MSPLAESGRNARNRARARRASKQRTCRRRRPPGRGDFWILTWVSARPSADFRSAGEGLRATKNASDPDVVWEGEFPDAASLARYEEIAGKHPDFMAVVQEMRTVTKGPAERRYYQLHSAPLRCARDKSAQGQSLHIDKRDAHAMSASPRIADKHSQRSE